ncbi:hypothetical protein [Pseudidiomarina insulisalsae]|uniref:hypothetical protein n=1 Tax=Pseudidiomarina insulisalsae TaxID=575789 RepID=UPI0018E4F221|nr:hypothetical protein [Pseudidiomarina insulisalsae]
MKLSKAFWKSLAQVAQGNMVQQGNYKVAQREPLIKPHGYDEMMKKLKCCCC